MRLVNIIEATELLPELIESASKGETVFIVNEQQQAIAQLVPITSDIAVRPAPKFGSAAGLIRMADDFDEYQQLVADTSDVVPPPKRKLGTGKGQFRITDDFDAPLDDFAEYQ